MKKIKILISIVMMVIREWFDCKREKLHDFQGVTCYSNIMHNSSKVKRHSDMKNPIWICIVGIRI